MQTKKESGEKPTGPLPATRRRGEKARLLPATRRTETKTRSRARRKAHDEKSEKRYGKQKRKKDAAFFPRSARADTQPAADLLCCRRHACPFFSACAPLFLFSRARAVAVVQKKARACGRWLLSGPLFFHSFFLSFVKCNFYDPSGAPNQVKKKNNCTAIPKRDDRRDRDAERERETPAGRQREETQGTQTKKKKEASHKRGKSGRMTCAPTDSRLCLFCAAKSATPAASSRPSIHAAAPMCPLR